MVAVNKNSLILNPSMNSCAAACCDPQRLCLEYFTRRRSPWQSVEDHGHLRAAGGHRRGER